MFCHVFCSKSPATFTELYYEQYKQDEKNQMLRAKYWLEKMHQLQWKERDS